MVGLDLWLLLALLLNEASTVFLVKKQNCSIRGKGATMNDTQSQTESLLEIVRSIEKQTIMLPEFQRDFRWELEQTYDLFDSLIREIFIGTLIYGKPSFGMTVRAIDTRPRKGKESNTKLRTHSYSTDEITIKAQTQNFRIVLDGQQRITSIYRAIVGMDAVYILLHDHLLTLDVGTIKTLSLEEMVQSVTGEESDVAISVKLSDAYDVEIHMLEDEELNERFAKTFYAQKALKEADESQQRTARILYRRAIYQLIDLYKQQKLVAFYLHDMSLHKFCAFFERSNSRGIQLNFTDILAAKLFHGFNLRKKIEEFEGQNPFITLNREIIIRAIAYIVGSVKTASSDKKGSVSIDKDFILKSLDAGNFERYWDDVCRLYTESLQYLADQHYILSQSWMPSENMVIPVMMFLRHIKSFDRMTEEQRQFLEYWYWASVFSNRYSGASNEAIITDSTVLIQIARGEKIMTRNYFMRLRSLITEPGDLFSYTKKSSAIYRGILNLLGYDAKGLKDWTNTQTLNMSSMNLEDHHIYPRAYILSKPPMEGIKQSEAEQFVDCVVNRTLIPKILNIKIGKKAPSVYLSELQQKANPKLAECLTSHLIPEEIITDETWDILFKLFLEDRAQSIFDLIEQYTIERAAEISARHSIQTSDGEMINAPSKPRLKDLIATGRVRAGERVFTKKKPERFATIIDGDTVEFEGKQMPINTWGQNMTGWSSISIYNSVFLARTGQPLKNLREQEVR